MNTTAVADKTCRICGAVDTKNLYLFDVKLKSLLYKILTIFPITIYESDPLPKNICKKCVLNVSLMYDENQKLMRVQKKWIDNVRTNQPDHPYVYILNVIANSSKELARSIKTIAPDFIYSDLRSMINNADHLEGTELDTATTSDDVSNHLKLVKHAPSEDTKSSITLLQASNIMKDLPPSNAIQKNYNANIQDIQNKLRSNGCTLSIKALPPDNRIQTVNKARWTSECKYCGKIFPNCNFLAKHQLNHMSVADRRIFDRRYLEKKIRRGRHVGETQNFRCLNCWKLFVDNRTILNHWSKGECDFFCQICGEDFAHNPKLLRQHVPMVHGINYKSSKRRPDNKFTKDIYFPQLGTTKWPTTPFGIKIKTEPIDPTDKIQNNLRAKTTTKKVKMRKTILNAQGRVSCNICFCTFPNFQSKNSHMRKHKNEKPAHRNTNFKNGKRPIKNIVLPKIKTEPKSNYEVIKAVNSDLHKSKLIKNSSITSLNGGRKVTPRLQVKRLIDLQDPSISSQLSEDDVNSRTTSELSEEPTDKKATDDHMQYGKIYNCHPCGQKFSSKTELFQHKRQCQSNNKFACRFCLRAFVTSADLQVHIMLMHRNS